MRKVLILLLILRRERQGENKLASYSFRTDHIDMFPVAVDDLFYNGKTQSGSFFVLAPGKIGFIESVPDHFQVILGNTDAGVFYRNKKLVLFQGSFYLYDRIVVAEFDGIIN